MFKIWYEYDKEKKNILFIDPERRTWEKEKPIPNLIKGLKGNKKIRLKKIDKNETEYYETNLCPNCVGEKEVIDNATYKKAYSCNLCSGLGFLGKNKIYRIHTFEYGKVLRKNYIDAKNKRFLSYHGINKDGSTNIYINLDWRFENALKVRGAKYIHAIDRLTSLKPIEGYECVNFKIPFSLNEDGTIYIDTKSKEINDLKVEIIKIEEGLNSLQIEF